MSTAIENFTSPEGATKGLLISGEEFRRPIPFGSTWTEITGGILFSCEDQEVDINGELWAGFCNKDSTLGDPFENTAIAFKFGAEAKGTAPLWTYTGGGNSRAQLSSTGRRASKFSGGVETNFFNSTSSTQAGFLPCDSGLTVERLHYSFRVKKSGSDWIFSMRGAGRSDGIGLYDWNPGAVLKYGGPSMSSTQASRIFGSASLWGNLVPPTTTAQDVTQGDIDALFVYWKQTGGLTSRLRLHGYYVKRIV